MAKKEVKQWITVKGVHIPIFEGQSKEEAVKAALEKRKSAGPISKATRGKKIAEHTKKATEYASAIVKRELAEKNYKNAKKSGSEDRIRTMDRALDYAKDKEKQKHREVVKAYNRADEAREKKAYEEVKFGKSGKQGQITHYSDINQVPKKLKPGEQYALYLKKGKVPNDGSKFAGQSYNAEYQGKGTYGVSNPKNMSPVAGFKTYEAMKKAYEERSKLPGQSYEIAVIKPGDNKNVKISPSTNNAEKSTSQSVPASKGSAPEFKSRQEAEEYYRNKFAGVSSTYANKMAKKLGVEGRGKDKREALAKAYADKWETSHNISNNEAEKEKQIARNQQEANNAKSSSKDTPQMDRMTDTRLNGYDPSKDRYADKLKKNDIIEFESDGKRFRGRIEDGDAEIHRYLPNGAHIVDNAYNVRVLKEDGSDDYNLAGTHKMKVRPDSIKAYNPAEIKKNKEMDKQAGNSITKDSTQFSSRDFDNYEKGTKVQIENETWTKTGNDTWKNTSGEKLSNRDMYDYNIDGNMKGDLDVTVTPPSKGKKIDSRDTPQMHTLTDEEHLQNKVNELNDLHKAAWEYGADKDAIKSQIKTVMDGLPDGTVLGRVTQNTHTQYTSQGAVQTQDTEISKLYKINGKWSRYKDGSGADDNVASSIIYNSGEWQTLEQAEKRAAELKKGDYIQTKRYGIKEKWQPTNEERNAAIAAERAGGLSLEDAERKVDRMSPAQIRKLVSNDSPSYDSSKSKSYKITSGGLNRASQSAADMLGQSLFGNKGADIVIKRETAIDTVYSLRDKNGNEVGIFEQKKTGKRGTGRLTLYGIKKK